MPPPGCAWPPVHAALKVFHGEKDYPPDCTPLRVNQQERILYREAAVSDAAVDKTHVLGYLGIGRLCLGGKTRPAALLELGLCTLAQLQVGPGGKRRGVSPLLGANVLYAACHGTQQLHIAGHAYLDAKAANLVAVEADGCVVFKVADFGTSLPLEELAAAVKPVGECHGGLSQALQPPQGRCTVLEKGGGGVRGGGKRGRHTWSCDALVPAQWMAQPAQSPACCNGSRQQHRFMLQPHNLHMLVSSILPTMAAAGGTERFVAPEVLLGAPFTLAAETWMLSCMLLEARFARMPWYWLEPLEGPKPAAINSKRARLAWYDSRISWATLAEEDCPYRLPQEGATPLTARELELLRRGLHPTPGERCSLQQLLDML